MSLLDLLSCMKPRRKRLPPKRPPSPQALAVVEILNVNNGCEMETVEIARLAQLKRDSVLTIMERLSKTYKISSRITTSSERRRGKHSKTKVKKWTPKEIIRL